MSRFSSNGTRIDKVRLETLTIDPRVQRYEGVDDTRVSDMAEKFNPMALGTITISQRPDGSLVVIDGAHRTAASRQAGYTNPLNATIHTGLTIEQEAQLFLLLNATKTPSVISKFLVRVVMGDPDAVAISDIITAHGWKVSPSAEPGCLAAIDKVEKIYRNGAGTKADGVYPHLLDQVLEVVTAAWEHDNKSTNGAILQAVAQLYGRFEGGVQTKKLVEEMAHTRPDVLLGKAKTLRDIQGGTVPAAMAKILAGMVNKGRRTNLLPEWVWIR